MQKDDNRVNSLLSLVVGVWEFLRRLAQWQTGYSSPCSANTSWHECAEPGTPTLQSVLSVTAFRFRRVCGCLERAALHLPKQAGIAKVCVWGGEVWLHRGGRRGMWGWERGRRWKGKSRGYRAEQRRAKEALLGKSQQCVNTTVLLQRRAIPKLYWSFSRTQSCD